MTIQEVSKRARARIHGDGKPALGQHQFQGSAFPSGLVPAFMVTAPFARCCVF